jgi:hypothetical protein
MNREAMKIEVVKADGKMNVPDKPIFEERNLICARPYDKKANMSNAVTVRWYKSNRHNAHTIHCCIWVFGKDHSVVGHRSGSGKAGGYGYCKSSAAFAEALENAGFRTPFDSISGRGMYVVEDAIKGIGILLGYSIDNMIVVGG